MTAIRSVFEVNAPLTSLSLASKCTPVRDDHKGQLTAAALAELAEAAEASRQVYFDGGADRDWTPQEIALATFWVAG